ncbi:MAG: tetratricopeptide repeat protein, partial [Planctomycetota bacterium]
EVDPSYEDVAMQLVTRQAARGELTEIQTDLERILARAPEESRVRTALAECLMTQGKYADVLALFDDWLREHPNDHEIAANLALFRLRCPDDAFRRPQQGLMMLENLCADTGYKDCRLLFYLATAYTAAGRLDEAAAVADRARAIAEEQGEQLLVPAIDALLEQHAALRAQPEQATP